jgi:glucokinase
LAKMPNLVSERGRMEDLSHWILADTSRLGTVTFARALPNALQIEERRSYPSERFPTFSDALLCYVRETGVELRAAGCVLSLPGPTAGDSIRIARTRWTLSRTGLGSMFGGPLAILNDNVATGWSLVEGPAKPIDMMDGAPRPNFAREGRWVLLLLDDGVGAAVLSVDRQGRASVADAEPGHIGFSPASADEFALMQSLRGRHGFVSWEEVLTTDRHSGGRLMSEREWAGLAGAFAGDVLLATAAWSGVILFGGRTGALRTLEARAEFATRMAAKTNYGRYITQAGRGLLKAHDPLMGCFAYLQRRVHHEGWATTSNVTPMLRMAASY